MNLARGFFIWALYITSYNLFSICPIYCVNQENVETYRNFNKLREKRDYTSNSILQPPTINEDLPIAVRVTEQSFRLTCKAVGNPTPTYKWFVGLDPKISFTEIVDGEKYVMHPDGHLDFTSLSTNPKSYYCQAINILGSVFSRKTLVEKVYTTKDLKITYESTEISLNEKAVITCQISPMVFFEEFVLKHWEIKFENRREIPKQISKTEGRYSVITVTKLPQLHIRNITKNDFDQLRARCIFVHRATQDDTIETIDWGNLTKYMPHNHKTQQYAICSGKEIRVLKGSTVELPWCSYPFSESIVWYTSKLSGMKKRQRIDLQNSKFSLVSERFQNLLIHNIDITEEGYYFPVSDSYPLKGYSPFIIGVTVKLGIEIIPNRIEAACDDSVILRCIVTGYPVPTIKWFHNSKPLDPGFVKELGQTTRMTILEFNITLETAGVYQCVAELRDSSDNRLLDNVQLSAPVIISSMAPRLISHIPPASPGDPYSTISMLTDTSVTTIQCVFNSFPEVALVWYLDGQPIPIVDALIPRMERRGPFTVEHSLVIDMKKLSSIGDKWLYGGEYLAEAKNKHGKAKCSTLVFVSGVFRIRDQEKTTFYHGQKLSLKCYVISESRPEQIQWYRFENGKVLRLPNTHLEAVSKDNREFTIQKLDKNIHEGIYSCNSTLKDKEISKNFSINIAKPPIVLVDLPEQVFVNKLSGYISRPCMPRQRPDEPWYAWWEFRPNDPNKTTQVIQVLSRRETTVPGIFGEYQMASGSFRNTYTTLPKGVPNFLQSHYNQPVQIWVGVKPEFHLSNITCVVQNHAGFIRKTMRITLDNIDFEHTPPPLREVILGNSFTLNCTAKPNQFKTIVMWNYEEDNLLERFVNVNTNTSSSFYQLSNGTLVVNKIKLSDPRRFICIIKSNISPDKISKVVNIIVHVPANIRKMNSTTDLYFRTKQNVSCIVHGDKDQLKINWYRIKENGKAEYVDKTITESNEQLKETRKSLVFDYVDYSDTGRYTCSASNKFNDENIEETVLLNVVDVPGAVNISLTSIKIGNRSIEFQWSPPEYDGKKPIFKYLVQYSTESEVWNETTTKTGIILKSLRPHHLYKIGVRAVNAVGFSASMNLITVHTLQAAPDGPVRNLSAFEISSTSFRVNWNSPDPLLINGNITFYHLCYLHTEVDKVSLEKLVQPEKLNWPSINKYVTNHKSQLNKYQIPDNCRLLTGHEEVLTDLLKFTMYAFRVIAINAAGYSPAAFTSKRTLEDYPEMAPIHVSCRTQTKSILVEWNPPPKSYVNGILKNYQIIYFPTNQHREPDHEQSSVNTVHTLDNLLPNTNYTIQIRAINNKGSGPPSESVYCITNEGIPSAPSAIKAFFVNESCVMVAWVPPNEANGIIRKYQITFIDSSINFNIPAEQHSLSQKYIWCDFSHNNKPRRVSVSAQTQQEGPTINTTILKYNSARAISFSREIIVNHLNSIVLDCETVANNVHRMWFYMSTKGDKREMEPDMQNGSLSLLPMANNQEGTFECSINSGMDHVKYNVSIKSFSHGVPRKPTIDFYNVSTDSIFVSWKSAGSPRDDDPIKSFVIRVTGLSENSTEERDVPGALRSSTLSKLECGSQFKLEAFARNNAGNSTHHTIYVQTLGTKPVIPNTDMIVIGKHSKSMCFNLKAFLPGHGCHANNFQVTITPTNQGQMLPSSGIITDTVWRSNLKDSSCYNVTDLHPDTDYNYEIEAFNRNGSVKASGHFKTPPLIGFSNPSVTTDHKTAPTIMGSFYSAIYTIVVVVPFVICIALYMYFTRRQDANDTHPPPMNNQLPIKAIVPFPSQTPKQIRNRQLPPTPPDNNVYHKGNPTTMQTHSQKQPKQEEENEDEMLLPYATYESVSKADPMNITTQGRSMASYNTSNLTHSYQYPDMIDNQPQLMLVGPTSLKSMTYENDLKQPLLNPPLKVPGRQYDKGYSVGESLTPSTLRPQNVRSDPHQSLDMASRENRGLPIGETEAYRPGSSLCSSNTESSTKEELSQFFRNAHGNQSSSRLPELDEDRDSTARGNRSTIISRSRRLNHTLSVDSIQPESYCESGSSGGDCGIRRFTQVPPGQQVIAPTIIRQFQPIAASTSAYDTVDAPQTIQVSNPSTFSQPSNHNLQEEDEEEDSNNYTNNFVVV